MKKTSALAAVRSAKAEDSRTRRDIAKADAKKLTPVKRINMDAGAMPTSATLDSFQNFMMGIGMGTDNANSASTYGFNPITRNRMLLEWAYRGSWAAGQIIDSVASDMTRAGIEHASDLEDEDRQIIDRCIKRLDVWGKVNEVLKWGRLYGGALSVVLIDGQDMAQPLRVETVGEGQFKGLMTFDRWMVEPALEDLVTEIGPHLGLPKYYRVGQNAPALRGQRIHHTRVAFRHVGVKLPYQQQLTENLWGLSVLERLWDRLLAFDLATNGIAQLIGKAYVRTLKIKDLRSIIASGGTPLAGLMQFGQFMRIAQSIEGVNMIDSEDEFDAQSHQAFSGVADASLHLAQQLAGAADIPLVRFLGTSPGGFGDGEGEMRVYYDGINQKQENELHHGVQLVYLLAGANEGITMPDDYMVEFAPLYRLDDNERAEIAAKDIATISAASTAGFISDRTALTELSSLSRISGRFTTISAEDIEAADEQVVKPPSPLELMEHEAKLAQQAGGTKNDDAPGNEDGNEETQPRKQFNGA